MFNSTWIVPFTAATVIRGTLQATPALGQCQANESTRLFVADGTAGDGRVGSVV
ncbi:MAG: hypothetical protein KAV82_00575 [Phycisphaerae bacterium]|nr:hypothetical protein [Phycisphaerae bacterium]